MFAKKTRNYAIAMQGLLRRDICRAPRWDGARNAMVFAVFVGLLWLTPLLFAAAGQYEIREVKPGVFVWIPDDIVDQSADPAFSRAGTAGFLVTSQGIAVIDTTNNPIHAREILYEIRQRTDAPISVVFNTGAQGDEILGNEVFADQEAEILASTAAEARMRLYQQDLARRLSQTASLHSRLRGIHLTLPSRAFSGQMSMVMDSEELKFLDLDCGEPGEPTGDSVLFLPRSKVLFLGNLFVNGYVPSIDSRNIRRWIDVLRQVEQWNVDVYVPGHGEPGGREQVRAFRGLLEWLLAQVETRVRRGESLSRVRRELSPMPPFRLRAWELTPRAIEAVYDQLAGGAKPPSPPPVKTLRGMSEAPPVAPPFSH